MKAILILFLVLAAVCLSGTIWQVNNDPNFTAHFTTLQAANDAATVNNGDTLYVYGSPASYGNVNFSKRLYIIGPGYYLLQNPQTQANPIPATCGAVAFEAGSEYSVITGMTIVRMTVSADNITIKRNNISNTDYNYSGILVTTAYNLLLIQNSIIVSVSSYYGSSSIRITGAFTHSTGMIISNNIIYNSSNESALTAGDLWGATISNNVVNGNVALANCEYFNNIQQYGGFSPSNVSFHHNIGSSSQYNPGGVNGNISYVNMATVFVWTGSTDGALMLLAGSPAYGAGFNGTDCGISGGAFPYVLSGMPSEIPSVHTFITSGAGYSIPVQVGAKSHN